MLGARQSGQKNPKRSRKSQQWPFQAGGKIPTIYLALQHGWFMTIQFHPKTGGRGIEWCDETRNATGGCLHDCKWEMPDGSIAACYAKELAEHGVAKKAYPHGFEHHYWRPDMLTLLVAGNEPSLIFCDSMSDLFAANVPRSDVLAVLSAMRLAPHHTYQSLTKAAPQLLKYSDEMPPNLWVGVSSPPDWLMGNRLSKSQQEAMLRRSLDVLSEIKKRTGNIVWMSAEPVSWDLTSVINDKHLLDWIVIGAASHGRKYFQPDADHIIKLLNVMDATATPVFFKGNIKPLFDGHNLGTEELNRWREDFPAYYHNGAPIPAVVRRQVMSSRHGWTQSRVYTPRLLNLRQDAGDVGHGHQDNQPSTRTAESLCGQH